MLSKEAACFVLGQELIPTWTVERKAKWSQWTPYLGHKLHQVLDLDLHQALHKEHRARELLLIITWLYVTLYPEHFYIAPSKYELQWELFPPSGRKVSPLLGIKLVPTGLMSGNRDATHCSIPCIYPKDVLRYVALSWSAYAYNRRQESHGAFVKDHCLQRLHPSAVLWGLISALLHSIQPWSTPLQRRRTSVELCVFRDLQLHGTVMAAIASLRSIGKQRDCAWNKSPSRPGLVHNWKFLHPQKFPNPYHTRELALTWAEFRFAAQLGRKMKSLWPCKTSLSVPSFVGKISLSTLECLKPNCFLHQLWH